MNNDMGLSPEEMEVLAKQMAENHKRNAFLLELGYEFTWGDGYLMVQNGEWTFESKILAECTLEALRHSGVRTWDTLRWMQDAAHTVETFNQYDFNLADNGGIDLIQDEIKKILDELEDSSK